MEALKPYRTPIILAVGAVVVVLALLLAFVLPEGHKLSVVDAEQQTLTIQEQTLQADIVALQHDKAQQLSNCATLGRALGEVPPALDEGQFVLDVGALAQQSGAPSIPSLTWGASTSGAGVDSVAVTLTLAGTFGQVMSFVKGLDGASFPRLFTVSTFTVGSAGGGSGGSGSSGSTANPVVVGTSLPSPFSPGYQVSLAGHIYYAPTLHDVCSAAHPAA